MECISENLDGMRPVDTNLLDFSRAFDKVPHQQLLIVKLRTFGIGVEIHDWLIDDCLLNLPVCEEGKLNGWNNKKSP